MLCRCALPLGCSQDAPRQIVLICYLLLSFAEVTLKKTICLSGSCAMLQAEHQDGFQAIFYCQSQSGHKYTMRLHHIGACRFNRSTTPWLLATFHAPFYSSCKYTILALTCWPVYAHMDAYSADALHHCKPAWLLSRFGRSAYTVPASTVSMSIHQCGMQMKCRSMHALSCTVLDCGRMHDS